MSKNSSRSNSPADSNSPFESSQSLMANSGSNISAATPLKQSQLAAKQANTKLPQIKASNLKKKSSLPLKGAPALSGSDKTATPHKQVTADVKNSPAINSRLQPPNSVHASTFSQTQLNQINSSDSKLVK